MANLSTLPSFSIKILFNFPHSRVLKTTLKSAVRNVKADEVQLEIQLYSSQGVCSGLSLERGRISRLSRLRQLPPITAHLSPTKSLPRPIKNQLLTTMSLPRPMKSQLLTTMSLPRPIRNQLPDNLGQLPYYIPRSTTCPLHSIKEYQTKSDLPSLHESLQELPLIPHQIIKSQNPELIFESYTPKVLKLKLLEGNYLQIKSGLAKSNQPMTSRQNNLQPIPTFVSPSRTKYLPIRPPLPLPMCNNSYPTTLV